MSDVRNAVHGANLLRITACVAALALLAEMAAAQTPFGPGMGGASSGTASRFFSRAAAESGAASRDLAPPLAAPAGESVMVANVRIAGNKGVSASKAQSFLKTRVGRAFDPQVIQSDVRALVSSGLFSDVRTYTQRVPDGMAVTFEVFERPIVRYVRFVGNREVRDKTLAKQSGIKTGDALNQFAVEEARRKIEEFYHSRGYGKATITILEGNRPKDAGIAFEVNEGNVEKILHTRFVGNTVVSDARLKTQIKSKPGILWIFKGNVDRGQVDEDLELLTAYYRGLGYFRARVGRELNFVNDGKWAIVTYVIDEGPRYAIRNVSFVGNDKFSNDQLSDLLELKPGEEFNLAELRQDERTLRDLYGEHGHIFADIEADPRFLEEPGQLDLVYDIGEGDQYRIGRISVDIAGDNPHTRRSVVLNRLSLLPGDIADSTQVHASERRLKSSQLFVNNPAQGVVPEIVMRPSVIESVGSIADRPTPPPSGSTYRGQSPDAQDAVRWAAEPARGQTDRQSRWRGAPVAIEPESGPTSGPPDMPNYPNGRYPRPIPGSTP